MPNYIRALLLAISTTFYMQGANALSTVPFVGCSGDGVLGQTGASTGKSLIIGIPQNVALKLAIYAGSTRMDLYFSHGE
jgi:hypothetical protein